MDDSALFLALEKMLDDESGDPIVLPFSFLKAITGNFSESQRIGSGGFGAVYKGTLQNGIVVAVKKLNENIDILEKNFKSEVDCLIQVKHENIVQFLGYSSETQYVRALYEGDYVWAEIRRRLFCFEYLSNGNLANYITADASSGLQWRVRFEIIKGICEGLHHLHQKKIVHLDFKPQNILLDDKMVPKIADFGLSRRLREDQSKIITENRFGSRGYLAPEFLKNGIITLATDIYSLGVIITEVLMGCKECPNVEEALKRWTNMFGRSERQRLLEQVKACAEISINCKDDDPKKRPAIMDIIRRLNEVDISNSSIKSARSHSPRMQLYPELNQKNERLDVHPLKLCFRFEAKNRIQCSLSLINRTEGYAAYWIIPQFPDMYNHFDDQPYILCPLSTLIVHVTIKEQQLPPVDAGVLEILMSSMRSESVLKHLISSIGKDSKKIDDGLLCKHVSKLGGEVYAAKVTTVVACRPLRLNCQLLSSAPKIVWKKRFVHMGDIDVHPTAQPWILVGHKNYVSIWDYENKERIVSLDVNWKACKLCDIINGETKVNSVRFIPQKHWFVAGDNWGYIYVYTCHTWKKIKRFRASGGRSVVSLAIHPTCPYLLSACEDGVIKLWDWDIGWACSRVVCHLFPAGKTIRGRVLVKFNPKDANTFTSHDQHGLLKVWSITLDKHITTINRNCTEICDHVFTETGRNHLVNIAYNTINIWDLEATRVVRGHTLYDTGCLVTAVACHPTLPLIVAGIKINDITHAAIRFWNSTNYRLLKTISCTSGPMIKCLAFVGSKRLVIGTEYWGTIEVLEFDMDSLVCQR